MQYAVCAMHLCIVIGCALFYLFFRLMLRNKLISSPRFRYDTQQRDYYLFAGGYVLGHLNVYVRVCALCCMLYAFGLQFTYSLFIIRLIQTNE